MVYLCSLFGNIIQMKAIVFGLVWVVAVSTSNNGVNSLSYHILTKNSILSILCASHFRVYTLIET